MQEFEGRVAVVTGAASGIGRALAERFAQAGMRVVLGDIEEQALEATAGELRESGAELLAVPTDVSSAESVEALAEQAYGAFGAVHVLCNNAGVGGANVAAYRTTPEDWQWTLGVNLWGVVHGVRAFLPRMLDGGEEGHVVNTASVAGLTALPGNAAYGVSKAGVVALSEALFLELERRGAPLGASVLCPGLVQTNILTSGRNRPEQLRNAEQHREGPGRDRIRAAMADAMPPSEVAERVFEAIREGRFWILTDDEIDPWVRQRRTGFSHARTRARGRGRRRWIRAGARRVERCRFECSTPFWRLPTAVAIHGLECPPARRQGLRPCTGLGLRPRPRRGSGGGTAAGGRSLECGSVGIIEGRDVSGC